MNQIIKAYLRCYINLQQDNWVEMLPVAQMQYNSSTTETTGVTPFYANYGFTPEAYRPPRDGPNADNARILAEDMIQLQEELKVQLEFFRQRTKEYADRTRIEGPTLQEGDMVYLLRHSRNKKLPNIRTNRPSDKLDFRKLGPFKILKKIGEVNYELDLPENIRLKTAVFHVSLLEKALVDEETGEPIMDEIIVQDIEEEYEIEKLVRMQINEIMGEREYLAKWKGYDDNENSWVPERELKRNAQAILREFHQSLGFEGRPINVVDGLGRAGNGRIRRQQGNLTSGLRFTFLALNPFQLFQIIQPPRNRTLHPPRPLSFLSTKTFNLRTKLQPGLFGFFKLLVQF
ncbi:hypothetical protein MKX08_005084 [Trichoderma sp. CBMAI-0020]|nr:hypothetical protein MKX08_005084 [Trichoderma sp. CBMAI-0020]